MNFFTSRKIASGEIGSAIAVPLTTQAGSVGGKDTTTGLTIVTIPQPYFDGLSAQEIATRCGMSIQAVEGRRQHGLEDMLGYLRARE